MCSRISEPSSYSRFLFPTFSCTKEKWENETCDRPLRPESASNSATFQDGDQQIYQGFSSFRYMWTTSLGLTDAYFHIPISPKFRKLLRFVWEDRVYAFKKMPFGLSTAPVVFTRIFHAVVAHLHSQSIFIHSYLDDFLLKNMSDFTQDKRGWLQDHSYRSGLAKTILVSGSSTIIVCRTVRLPLRGDLLYQFKGKKLHQGLEKLHLHTWLLSGLLSDREAFLKKQESAFLEQLDSQQGQYMTQNGQSYVLDVCQNKLILSVSLLSN